MCGVIGFISMKDRPDMGILASKLLRMLEYRGYDSTGAVIQDSTGRITLRKDVGSPTAVTRALKIHELQGRIFCGQVRWATFGTVTKENAQPHDVKCRTHIYGAHNGNITNCDQLKKWLLSEGHNVISDNDGEMLVHTIEHFFALELEKLGDEISAREKYPARISLDEKAIYSRRMALRTAIVTASSKIIGSFAAVVVDPVSETMACIKAGSSLYFGVGHDENYGPFSIASSDLSAVLSLTKVLLGMNEKEFAIYTADKVTLYNLESGREIQRTPARSHLRIEETELKPPFKYFMEQEIHAQVEASRRVINLYTGRSPLLELVRELAGREPDLVKNIKHAVKQLADLTDYAELRERAAIFASSGEVARLKDFALERADDYKKAIRETGYPSESASFGLESSLSVFLEELRNIFTDTEREAVVTLIDALFLLDEITELNGRIKHFVDMMVRAYEFGSSIYLIACGTSFHAAKTATLFFDRIANLPLFPLLPGEFRSQCANSIRDRDVIIGISQSGETKDLIDIFNLIRKTHRNVTLVSIVNNTNSSLALEKSELFIPLFCGPEIAVPATKSFLNQILVLYILALRVAERFVKLGIKKVEKSSLERYWKNLERIPELIKLTLEQTREDVEKIAGHLYLAPSIHILATGMLGIAKEGALKIREVVLNHTEGFEGSEFKHGPNTILGLNTVFGMGNLRSVLEKISNAVRLEVERSAEIEESAIKRARASAAGGKNSPCSISPSFEKTVEKAGTGFQAASELCGKGDICSELTADISVGASIHPDGVKTSRKKNTEGSDHSLAMESVSMNTADGNEKITPLDARGVARLFHAIYDYAFNDHIPEDLTESERLRLMNIFKKNDFFESLYDNYPLIFVTGSSERDVNLTISQINTHKIRGANCFVIAEENEFLKEAISNVPETRHRKKYRWGYITLPHTGDELLPSFTATVALQLLALEMSIKKMQLLDRLEIREHGVHPDSPKNVSKSITVD